VSAPSDLRRSAHLAYDGRQVSLQVHQRDDDIINLAWSMPYKCKYEYRSNSERDSEWLRYRNPIGPGRNWIWLPNVLNSLPNGITKDSRENYQEMTTGISPRRILLSNNMTHGEREDFWQPYRTKPLIETLTKWCTEWWRDDHRTAYLTECGKILPND